MAIKQLIPCIYLKNDTLYTGFDRKEIVSEDTISYVIRLCASYADALLIFDLSDNDSEHDGSISTIRKINSAIDIKTIACGNIKRLEDVKKLIYAGCSKVGLNMAKPGNVELIEEASKRFGKEKILCCIDSDAQVNDNIDSITGYSDGAILIHCTLPETEADIDYMILLNDADENDAVSLLKCDMVSGISGEFVNMRADELVSFKNLCKKNEIDVNTFESSLAFEDFKKNADGHVTCVVQDYKTDEVLMVAYMNEEAFNETVRTGRMTYFSRSRNELWIKGETSGHYQYVRALYADCDRDTILAKVMQVGAACHTGNKSCFYTEILKKDYQDTNPLRVFEKVYNVIMDRKIHPKEGSYTNYLFDKGIDKILKKVGEEATEIVIAAKNPDSEEVKYEIADFLYHVMVLMAECNLTWEDITKELANR